MVRKPDAAEPCPLDQIPGGLFILTAHYEGRRDAILVKWIQQCSDAPPMIMVALAKGQAIEQLIHGSQKFALCQIGADDRFLIRKFHQPSDSGDDALISMMTRSTPGGSPIVDRAMSYMDCQIVRHVELDSDFRIYVGQVQGSAMLNVGRPAICLGGNGLENGTAH